MVDDNLNELTRAWEAFSGLTETIPKETNAVVFPYEIAKLAQSHTMDFLRGGAILDRSEGVSSIQASQNANPMANNAGFLASLWLRAMFFPSVKQTMEESDVSSNVADYIENLSCAQAYVLEIAKQNN